MTYDSQSQMGQFLIDKLVEEVPSLTRDQAVAIYESKWLENGRNAWTLHGVQHGVQIGSRVGAAMGQAFGYNEGAEVGYLEGLFEASPADGTEGGA